MGVAGYVGSSTRSFLSGQILARRERGKGARSVDRVWSKVSVIGGREAPTLVYLCLPHPKEGARDNDGRDNDRHTPAKSILQSQHFMIESTS